MSRVAARTRPSCDAAAAPAGAPSTATGNLLRFEMVRQVNARILAVGAERKSSVCLCGNRTALLGPSLGDLMDPAVYRAFCRQLSDLCRQTRFEPTHVTHDLHPQLLSTVYARSTGLPTIAVQHHHAHVAAVMAEWRIERPAVGICCDGTGHGTDGLAWGCEVLTCHRGRFERAGHLEPFALIGGDAAAVETTRPAFALVRQAFGPAWRQCLNGLADRCASDWERFERIAAAVGGVPETSSLGRVFDGISFLLGLCERNDRPAQAAIALERAADHRPAEPYPYETTLSGDGVHMSLAPTVRRIVEDLSRGVRRGRIAARFHETVARMLAAAADLIAQRSNIGVVVVSGGCFANRRLCSRLVELMERRHFQVFLPRRGPIGDEGIALGQAAVAAAILEGRDR